MLYFEINKHRPSFLRFQYHFSFCVQNPQHVLHIWWAFTPYNNANYIIYLSRFLDHHKNNLFYWSTGVIVLISFRCNWWHRINFVLRAISTLWLDWKYAYSFSNILISLHQLSATRNGLRNATLSIWELNQIWPLMRGNSVRSLWTVALTGSSGLIVL